MANINVTVRVDKELKQQAEELFGELGISLSNAFSLFLRQCVIKQGIPFAITRASGPCVFSSDEEVIALANEILSKRRKVFEELAK